MQDKGRHISWCEYPSKTVSAIVDGSVQTVSVAITTLMDVCFFWTRRICSSLWSDGMQRSRLQSEMVNAMTYSAWKDAALRLDHLTGGQLWKETLESGVYDWELIQEKLEQLRKAKECGDRAALQFLLRIGIHRNIGGILQEHLYYHTHTGTKELIEQYLDEVCNILEDMCVPFAVVNRYSPQSSVSDGQSCDYISQSAELIELRHTIKFFKELKHTYGTTALLFSGGGGMGVYHLGVSKCLAEQHLLPRVISGSSSGSYMAAILGTKHLDEIDYENSIFYTEGRQEPDVPFSFFYGIYKKFRNWMNIGSMLDPDKMRDSIRAKLGDITFLEGYHKTRRVLNITISSSTSFEMPKLLNYMTAPNVVVWSAVMCSCSVPRILPKGVLYSKTSQSQLVPWNETSAIWSDGSIEGDLPMRHLSQMFHINHFIVSQVNPHVLPFLSSRRRYEATDNGLWPWSHMWHRLSNKLFILLKSELLYRLPTLIDLGILPRFCHILLSILSQHYEGDITIAPDRVTFKDLVTLFSDPAKDRVQDCITAGERFTWPKISMIQNNTKIERKLDEMLHKLRCRMLDLVPHGSGAGSTGQPGK